MNMKTKFIEVNTPPISNAYFTHNCVLRIKEGEVKALEELCDYYEIAKNDSFKRAINSDIYWQIGPRGIFRPSPLLMLNKTIDFYSLKELILYLIKFIATC